MYWGNLSPFFSGFGPLSTEYRLHYYNLSTGSPNAKRYHRGLLSPLFFSTNIECAKPLEKPSPEKYIRTQKKEDPLQFTAVHCSSLQFTAAARPDASAATGGDDRGSNLGLKVPRSRSTAPGKKQKTAGSQRQTKNPRSPVTPGNNPIFSYYVADTQH